MGGASGDMKSPSMHGMKGAMSPVIRGPGGPGMAPGRNDPVGAREEVSDRRSRRRWGRHWGPGPCSIGGSCFLVV